jgi:hypothetical protein
VLWLQQHQLRSLQQHHSPASHRPRFLKQDWVLAHTVQGCPADLMAGVQLVLPPPLQLM